ncbi:MAG: methylmalonyl Co-A mutase-associated GTPase MeaB [Flavobacteriales bacterium]
MNEDSEDSGLSKEALERFRKKGEEYPSNDELFEGIRKGERASLSRAITLVEGQRPDQNDRAQELVETCLPYAGASVRIGITGVPGVGKSTFLEALGTYLTGRGKKVAVLAVDPSSENSKGSILGDKTRMGTLASDPDAFIRPSPSAGSLGGVARKTRESMILCEAAGFDRIFVETVGVGQSETTVHSMVDLFLLLMLAGAGDELQGIKRGIMEMADLLVINKADEGNEQRAKEARDAYKRALHLLPPSQSGWEAKVTTCSSTEGKNIEGIWGLVEEQQEHVRKNGYFDKNRQEQARYWMHQAIEEALRDRFYRSTTMKPLITEMEEKVMNGERSSYAGARDLLDQYYGSTE